MKHTTTNYAVNLACLMEILRAFGEGPHGRLGPDGLRILLSAARINRLMGLA